MVERLTNLIAIFENPALDFSKNRADGDDLLGRLRISYATFRDREWQEQGPVLYPSRSEPAAPPSERFASFIVF